MHRVLERDRRLVGLPPRRVERGCGAPRLGHGRVDRDGLGERLVRAVDVVVVGEALGEEVPRGGVRWADLDRLGGAKRR